MCSKSSALTTSARAINPDLVLTQIEGGAVHGLSSAFEGYIYDKQGKMLNHSLVDYKIATSMDAPHKIQGEIVESGSRRRAVRRPGSGRACDGSDRTCDGQCPG